MYRSQSDNSLMYYENTHLEASSCVSALAPISSLWPNLPGVHLDPKGYFLSLDPDLEHWGLAGVNCGEHMQQGPSSAGLR